MSNSRINDFYNQVSAEKREHPFLREGQILFNVLCDFDRNLAERVRGTAVDPFYKTGDLTYFYELVENNLGK